MHKNLADYLAFEANFERLLQIEHILKTRVLNQKGDDVCWLDIYRELSELCGMPPFDPQLIDRKQFLERNCPHFYDCLASGQPYTAPDS